MVTIGDAAVGDAGVGDGLAQRVGVVLGGLADGQVDAVLRAAGELDAEVRARLTKTADDRRSTMITAEMAYQSRLRPTKSIDCAGVEVVAEP